MDVNESLVGAILGIATMIVILSVRFLLCKGKEAWGGGAGRGGGKTVSVLIEFAIRWAVPDRMGHEYCLDILCLSKASVSKDTQ